MIRFILLAIAVMTKASPALSFESALVEVLYHTNQERIQHGLPGLSPSNGLEIKTSKGLWGPLQQAAHNHARDMALRNFFSHTTPEGWSLTTRLEGLGYWGVHGENIYCGQPEGIAAYNGWRNSPGHRSNYMNPNFRTVGIAHYYNPHSSCRHYWVMVLGTE